MNFLFSPSKKPLNVSQWEDLSTNSDPYVDSRHYQVRPSTHPILILVQSTPLVQPTMTKRTLTTTTIAHTKTTDSEDDNIVCDISIQADKPRLWQPKEAHEILRRNFASRCINQDKLWTHYSVLYVLGFTQTLLPLLSHHCQQFNRLLIEEEERQLLCYNKSSEILEEENLRTCLPFSLFVACFQLGHYNEMLGHMASNKTYANTKRF